MQAPQTVRVLMTGAGAPGAPGILKCLQFNPNFEIFMADANPNAIGRWLHAEFDVIPYADDNRFVEELLAVCKKRKIDILLPLVTKELIPLARNKKIFEAIGTRVLVSNVDSLEIANDKSKLYQFLEWRGLPIPAYRIVETVDQFKEAVKELGYPGAPVCFKPSVSNGSRGFRVISNDVDESHLLFDEKPYSTYISYQQAINILSSKKFPELLVSEYLPGDEFSVDCLAKEGETVIALTRIRKAMVNGITVEGEFIRNDEIIDYCSSIIKQLKLHGNIGIQVKQSSSGKFLVIEINPRVQGTIVAGLGAGVNLPNLAIKQEMALAIHEEELSVKWGVKFSRYWNEVFY